MNMDKDKAEQAISKLHPYDRGDYQKLMRALETGDIDRGYEVIVAIAREFRLESDINSELILGFHRLRDYFLQLAKNKKFKSIKADLKSIAGKIDPDKSHQLSLFD
jgi:hypothetical protein